MSNYVPVDVVNGEGTRVTLFVSGCSHTCKGCYNQKTWRPDFGYEYTKEIEDAIIRDLNDSFIKKRGISLSGGDPLYCDNLETIYSLIKRVRRECPEKDIWLWSGYTLKQLEENKENSKEDMLRYKIVTSVDTFIDGKFEQENYDPSLRFRGSSNKIIHTFKI
jgi:anaerobic ribonucleoside-triphosphate reductase activating protein